MVARGGHGAHPGHPQTVLEGSRRYGSRLVAMRCTRKAGFVVLEQRRDVPRSRGANRSSDHALGAPALTQEPLSADMSRRDERLGTSETAYLSDGRYRDRTCDLLRVRRGGSHGRPACFFAWLRLLAFSSQSPATRRIGPDSGRFRSIWAPLPACAHSDSRVRHRQEVAWHPTPIGARRNTGPVLWRARGSRRRRMS